ncbi:proteasome-type protease [Acinetobacter sichuanensis]|uniref:Peptidase n=1 Tax=Acinetobacter sichuanensis TaxID=2136183 RepID=A0A371YT25_9GAMM|nr:MULTISPECIES: proteasome-type protease [Acinetobacter]MDM1248463.1 proteasome-type protease [Acinetobacter sp. R933-2]MDM1763117.1 proteasome-type protease [Acinetobacter sp. 226-1]MDM1766596.1 proteasome-type protease [Acinetobacter sp. 226-4]MDQ9020121.1 proteasome-type protease [Acinetobacter sichuanensis]RFC84514.1 peptidase [Acinetobacter sichuanensis]
MTYCCALRLKEGLVFISDTRTNAGVDHISVFRKLYTYGVAGERFICIQTSGNLATTQAVIGHLENHLALGREPHLYSVNTMFELAGLVGQLLRQVIAEVTSDTLEQSNYFCSLLVGGQIKGEEMQLYNIYPQGNFICATSDTPYFQIGESKYGKPILDRALTYDMPLDKALRCCLISFDSTLRSNVSVGMPLDAMIYHKDCLLTPQGKRITEADPYFQQISRQWSETLKNGLQDLPEPTEDYFK